MLFILILISSIFSFSYTQTIYGKEMIMERVIEESVKSWFDVYCINNRWFLVDWTKGEIVCLSDNTLRRKFGDVYGVLRSGRWENGNGILIGYRDPVFKHIHAVLYDITKDSLIEVTNKIPNGDVFINIMDVILPTSWSWKATIINSADGYLYYNSNSFKKVATFGWVNDGRIFLVNDTMLIGMGVSIDYYGNYVIVGGYYIIGQDPWDGLIFFSEKIIPNDMVIGGDIINNRILIGGHGDVYIFDIPSFTLVSTQKLINGSFIGADVVMLNENSGYIAFSSFNSTKIYKFVYSSDRIVLIDSLIVDGGWVKFKKFDGNIYLIVFQNPSDYGWALLRIYKIKDKVTTNPKEPELPTKFALYQNYPNPFNPSTTIEFDIPERTNVKLIIYDILGREVETLIDKELEPGKYKVNFNAKDLPSGVYFYTLKTPEFTKTNKMLLIK